MSEYFPESKSLGQRVTVELNLTNYATKADLKNATGVDTSKFAQNLMQINQILINPKMFEQISALWKVKQIN